MMIPSDASGPWIDMDNPNIVPVSIPLGRVWSVGSLDLVAHSVMISSSTSSNPGLALPTAAWRRWQVGRIQTSVFQSSVSTLSGPQAAFGHV